MNQSPHISTADGSFDSRLRAALHAAPVTDGLADRLMAALATVRASDPPSDVSTPPPDAAELPIPATRHASGTVRRDRLQAWFVRLAICAACVTFVAAVWSHFRQPPAGTWGPERIMRLVRDFDSQQSWPLDPLPGEGWKMIGQSPPDVRLPALASISPGSHWKVIAIESLERRGVVVVLRGRAGELASLYILPYDGPPGAPAFDSLPKFPESSGLSTGGSTSFAWSDGEWLFVLVTPGDPADAEQFLNDQGPLA